ncbi:cyclophane-forming radical SAM/SPASM peptide maturase GrrM/OscB [Oscillatoria amoena NRMC-F 0135]|nr:cyclophane-forming radical SAM/SPASM peptide maturase GrrM/OscB [Oscillatoria amoena NRMC-F 0135]
MEIGPLELLIFQGTPFCNIDCKYCYLPDRLNTSKMSLDIVRATAKKLVAEEIIRDDFAVLWHAGEPLVLPVAYYEQAIAGIRREVPDHLGVTFSFQTNGILLTDDWCRFFLRHNAELGISIDGPEFIHDRYRMSRSGKGTFKKVMQAIELVKQYGMPLHVISVLTDFSCDYAEELYGFYRGIGVDSVCLNAEEIEGVNTESSFSNNRDAKSRVTKFLRKLFDLNLADDEPLEIREFNWAKNSVLHGELDSKEYNFSQMTGTFKTITISTNGDFSTFSPELISRQSDRYGDFIIGNVLRDSFTSSLDSEKFSRIYNDLVHGIEKCKQNCGYYGLCPGGIPSGKFSEHKTLDADETQFCKLTFQAPIDALLEMVENEQGNYKL